ncbi:hypothetical protein B7486_54400, partial [cyanobacterium TDX16]
PAEAADRLRELLQVIDPDDAAAQEVDRWALMEALALADDRAAVRAVASELDMELAPGDGPWDEPWGSVVVEMGSRDEPHRHLAHRTGPVTARIIQPDPPDAPDQHCFAEVVFHAAPVEPFPEDEEERARFLVTFPAIGTLRPSTRVSFELEGVDPGQELWDELGESLRQQDHVLWIVSSGYRLQESDTLEEVPGVYALLAVEPTTDLIALDALLRSYVSTWDRPMTWPTLAAAAGRPADEAREVVDRYRLQIPVPVDA